MSAQKVVKLTELQKDLSVDLGKRADVIVCEGTEDNSAGHVLGLVELIEFSNGAIVASAFFDTESVLDEIGQVFVEIAGGKIFPRASKYSSRALMA